jgi:spermidine synthase
MSTVPVAFLLVYDFLILLSTFRSKSERNTTLTALILLFFCSGMPALVYQIVWQRALFAIYGVNSESVTVVVSAFMIGLGLGSLLGGWLSAKFPARGVFFFAVAELGTALFGIASLRIFHWTALHTAGAPLLHVVALSLALLLIPTIFMGATLPLLTEFFVLRRGEVAYSAGILYFANTFGSAVASYLCATVLLRNFGQSGSVRIAALMNVLVAAAVLLLERQSVSRSLETEPKATVEQPILSIAAATVLSALVAFISLGFEMVWFRLTVVASTSRAPSFALLLASFLAGVAAGSFFAGALAVRNSPKMAIDGICIALSLVGGLTPFLPPLVALLRWKGLNFLLASVAFFLAAALLGAVFPLLCRLAITPDRNAGRGVSLIYGANIAGSASGSLLVGFVLMNHWGMRAITALLAGAALALAFVLSFLWHARGTKHLALRSAVAGSVLVSLLAQTLYSHFAERLVFGNEAGRSVALADFVENRSGTIAVATSGAVFGDGVYDGFFSIDPLDDKNMIVRAYAIGAFHPSPKRMLMIGLSSGSWAQVLANHPDCESLAIIEINPGYLSLIRQNAVVKSLLENPKVRIVIDDGRRWLLAHPEQRYDLIVQNTTFYWRDHVAELLSTDYLRIIKDHLTARGIFYYNTTQSDDVLATGLAVFPYGLRVVNFLAVSDSPIVVDSSRWMSILRRYQIDRHPVFVRTEPRTEKLLEKYRNLADSVRERQISFGMENGDSMRERIQNPLIFTDDNMGWEWR